MTDRESLKGACQQWSIGGCMPIFCLCAMSLLHILRPWTMIAELSLLPTQLAATVVFAVMTRNDLKRLGEWP